MWKQTAFKVSEHNHVGEIRRFAQDLAKEMKFDEISAGKVSIVVTELATNIVKHAGTGEVLIIESPETIHLLAIDKGQGIRNLEASMSDGFSTGGTAGNGLGAIKRGADTYDLFTAEGKGTVFYAGFGKDIKNSVAAVCTPYPGEAVAGDNWAMLKTETGVRLILADGLGHGLLAHDASKLACDIFLEDEAKQERLMQTLHLALRPTRGAAVSLADIDFTKGTIDFCGVGNVLGSIKAIGSPGKKCISYNGTVGVQLRKAQSMTYPLEKDGIFVLASDGIGTQWELTNYPGIMKRHPFVIAGVLYRDFGKNTDDATVIVVREDE